MTKKILLFLFASLFAFAVAAEDSNSPFKGIIERSYAELHLGINENRLTVATGEEVFSENEFDGGANVGLFLGNQFYREINLDLAWEFSYLYFTETEGNARFSDGGDLQNQASDLYWESLGFGLKVAAALSDRFSFITRAGVHRWSAQVDSKIQRSQMEFDPITNASFSVWAPVFSANEEVSDTDIYYALGLQYDVGTNFYAGLEYFNYKINPFDARASIKSLSLSVGAHF